MNTNQNVALFSLIFLVVGIFVGWLIWGNCRTSSNSMMHDMGNGQMMSNAPATDMNSMMQNMTMGLSGKTGDAFDKEFLAEMIIHHEGAVAMAKQVLATSKRPELLQLANDIIAAQTKEIGMMQAWQKKWFNQ
jgi:uncharacterized protein (DUF305 family)